MAEEIKKNIEGESPVDVAPKQELSEFDKLIQVGNISAINEYIAAEAAKQGIDPRNPPRDDKGRFVSPDPKPEAQKKEAEADTKEADDPQEPIKYQLTVEIAPGKSIVVEDTTEDGVKLKADLVAKAAQAAKNAITPP